MIRVAPYTIQTPSQYWAKTAGACLHGRRRLGRMTVLEYFHSSKAMASDLIWIAMKLKSSYTWPSAQGDYEREVQNCWPTATNGGRHRTALTRKKLLSAMRRFNVQWPTTLVAHWDR